MVVNAWLRVCGGVWMNRQKNARMDLIKLKAYAGSGGPSSQVKRANEQQGNYRCGKAGAGWGSCRGLGVGAP